MVIGLSRRTMPFELYLVQHGKAKSEQEDPQRGLTDEGRQEVDRVASLLASAGVVLDRIEHSGKVRAKQTAELFAAKLHPRQGIRERPGLAPTDDPGPLARDLRDETGCLMLVGHLPHLARLASVLLAGSPEPALVQFRMGGVVRLDRDEAGRFAVRWAVGPDLVT